MKKYFVIAVLFTISLNLFAKGGEKSGTEAGVAVCYGTITDNNSNEALVGVSVTIDELNLTTYTDFDGNFSFDNIITGNYTFTVDYISYKNVKKEILVNGKKEVKLNMERL